MAEILFTMPSSFQDHKIQDMKDNIEKLKKQCLEHGVSSRIVVVGNDCENFRNFNMEGVEKLENNDKYNCAKSLNMGIDAIRDEKYWCFIHDDIYVHNGIWLKIFSDMVDSQVAKVGVVGLVSHTGSFIGKFGPFVSQHTWTDGVMFCSTDFIKTVGRFDESFVGDCEAQDYQYRGATLGYKNFIVGTIFTHKSVPFDQKLGEDERMKTVRTTRIKLRDKWHDHNVGGFILKFKMLSHGKEIVEVK